MERRQLIAVLTVGLLATWGSASRAQGIDNCLSGQSTWDALVFTEKQLDVKRTAVKAPSVTRTVRLELTSKLDNVTGIDNTPAQHSAGDVLIFTESLLNEEGSVVGHDAAVCTGLFDETMLCNGVYVLPGGQIMVQLLQPGLTGTYDQPITGGTGHFAGATGTVTVIQSASGDHFRFRIQIPTA